MDKDREKAVEGWLGSECLVSATCYCLYAPCPSHITYVLYVVTK